MGRNHHFCAPVTTHKATVVKADGWTEGRTDGETTATTTTIPFWAEGQGVILYVMTTNKSLDHVHHDAAVDDHDDDGVDNDDEHDDDDDDDDDYDDDSAYKLSVGYKSNHIIAMTSYCIHLKPLLCNCPVLFIVDVLRAQLIQTLTRLLPSKRKLYVPK